MGAGRVTGGSVMTCSRFGLPLIGSLLASVMLAAPAQAQKYPDHAVSIIVPFAPGGLTDVPARVLGAMLPEKLGQNVLVENKTGGTGTLGVAYVSRSAPDGYTLLANSLSDAQNLHFMPLPYDTITDFSEIGWIVDGPPVVMVIDASLPYKTLAEFVAGAKANPDKISFGTSGPASSPAIAVAQLNKAAGTSIVPVPYRGSGEAARAVATGAVQGVFTFYSQAKPLTDDGKLRALAVAAPTRLAGWPDVPTVKELGSAIHFRGYVGLSAPAKTPRPIIELLNQKLNEVVQSDLFKSRMSELGMSVPADNTPEKYDAYMREQIAAQGEVAKLT